MPSGLIAEECSALLAAEVFPAPHQTLPVASIPCSSLPVFIRGGFENRSGGYRPSFFWMLININNSHSNNLFGFHCLRCKFECSLGEVGSGGG